MSTDSPLTADLLDAYRVAQQEVDDATDYRNDDERVPDAVWYARFNVAVAIRNAAYASWLASLSPVERREHLDRQTARTRPGTVIDPDGRTIYVGSTK